MCPSHKIKSVVYGDSKHLLVLELITNNRRYPKLSQNSSKICTRTFILHEEKYHSEHRGVPIMLIRYT